MYNYYWILRSVYVPHLWGTKRFADTYRHKLIKADLIVLVFVTILHQFLDDLSDFVPRHGQIGLFEQVMELIVTDKAITVQI